MNAKQYIELAKKLVADEEYDDAGRFFYATPA